MDLTIPKIMGILNVTPDSFYDGGQFTTEKNILDQVEKMVQEGAHFIDVGGYSSRPGADHLSEGVEKERVIMAIGIILRNFPDTVISIDTFRSSVAEAAVDAGASMINDISGGGLDEKMFETVSRMQVTYVIIQMKGNTQTMNHQATYTNLMKEIIDYFHEKINRLQGMDIKDIIIDPGFGFAKTREHNFHMLHHLQSLSILGKPLLVGLSRKSMIWKTLAVEPEEALNGTTALNTIALLKGADILRVHDVKQTKEVIKLFTSFNDSSS